MGEHLVDGEFVSDKYPWCEPGFVPFKLTDEMAQPLLWQYAEVRRAIDPEFADDLQAALGMLGYEPTVRPVKAMAPPLIFLQDFPRGVQARLLRTARNLRQRDVAELAGCTQAEVSALEREEYVPPSIRRKIVQALSDE